MQGCVVMNGRRGIWRAEKPSSRRFAGNGQDTIYGVPEHFKPLPVVYLRLEVSVYAGSSERLRLAQKRGGIACNPHVCALARCIVNAGGNWRAICSAKAHEYWVLVAKTGVDTQPILLAERLWQPTQVVALGTVTSGKH